MDVNIKIKIELKGQYLDKKLELYKKIIERIKEEHRQTNDTLEIEVIL